MQPHIIKNDRVRLETHAREAGTRNTRCTMRKAQVRLLEHEGVVSAIELTCACGEVSVIALDYDTTDRAAAEPAPETASTEEAA